MKMKLKHLVAYAFTTSMLIGSVSYAAGSIIANADEPKLQFRVFLGNKSLILNSRRNINIYAIYKGNSILIEPTGTAKSPPT